VLILIIFKTADIAGMHRLRPRHHPDFLLISYQRLIDELCTATIQNFIEVLFRRWCSTSAHPLFIFIYTGR